MKFAIITEVPWPQPWKREDQRTAVHRCIEEARLAEEMGFHSYWAVEHHLIPDLSMSSAPEVLLSAIAQATSTIRIGHGVRLLPHGYNSPIRTAEMGAYLDIVSNGRLEFGFGRSASRVELEGFSIDPVNAGALMDEALEFTLRAWAECEMEFDGRFFKMPRRMVVPQPIQEPHPPLWMAGSNPSSHTSAGERGVGMMSFALSVGPDEVAGKIEMYRDGLTRAKPVGKYINDQAAVFTMVNCAPTAQKAKEQMESSVSRYNAAYGHIIADMQRWGKEGSIGTYTYFNAMEDMGDSDAGSYDSLVDMGAIISGDPDTCIEVAKRYEAIGTDLLLCLVNPAEVSREGVLETIELMGRYVLPEFEGKTKVASVG